jgi:two-component system KDP operon response regulator KdpE
VSRGDQELRLTPIEYDLLRQLALNPDVVMTHRLLLTRVWGAEYAEDTHTLRVHIANLRGKIEPDADRPRYIQTELRIGYRFRSET